MKKIILIGGSPAIGKSDLAMRLSKELNIPWISTDTIREFLKKLVSRKEYPDLFYFVKQKPEEYLSEHTPAEIVQDQNKESKDVWRGVMNFIETIESTWEGVYIVEGVAVLPELVYENYKNDKSVKTIFLVDDNEERIRKAIFTRGLWGDADEYSDNVKKKEIQ